MSVYQSASLSPTLSFSHPSSLDSVSPPLSATLLPLFPASLSLRLSSLCVWSRITNGLHWGVNCVGFCRLCTHTQRYHTSILDSTEAGVSGQRRQEREYRGKEADMSGCVLSKHNPVFTSFCISALFLHTSLASLPLFSHTHITLRH